jgi:hypothetical protein
MNKQIIFLSIMLLVTARAIQADFFIHNKTGDNGTPVKIRYDVNKSGNWTDMAPNESKKVTTAPGVYFFVAWKIGETANDNLEPRESGKLYEVARIKNPKDIYIRSNGEYHLWAWKNHLLPNAELTYDPFAIPTDMGILKGGSDTNS